MLKEALQALEKNYPDGLQGDIHYLAGLVNSSHAYRRQEIRSTIRIWEFNLQYGAAGSEEVKMLLAELQKLVEPTAPAATEEPQATQEETGTEPEAATEPEEEAQEPAAPLANEPATEPEENQEITLL